MLDHKIKIRTLVENTTISGEYKKKHGLCIYIETPNHKILFDLGPNDLFYKNALKMGIKIEDVDIVVISHGHLDHGGGLKTFLSHNTNAKIYIREDAFEHHTTKFLGLQFNCGIDPKYKDHPQVVLTKDLITIGDDTEKLVIFNDIKTRDLWPTSNNALFVTDKENKIELDNFEHEQNLLIIDRNTTILLAGCAHKGIVNIVRRAKELNEGKDVSCVIGGFHLFNPNSKKYESKEFIEEVGNLLKETKSVFFTCHCTGPKAFDRLKAIMGDQLEYLSTGRKLNIEVNK